MKVKNNNSLFKKEKNRNETMNKKLALAVVAVFVLILSGSLFAILAKNDFNVLSALSGEVVTEAVKDEENTAKPDIPRSDRYYLLYCRDDETSELKLLWIVRMRLPQRNFNFFAPSVQTVTKYGDEQISFNYIYRTHGAQALREAVEKEYGIKISNYVSSDVNSFKSMINYIGGINFNVPEKVEYRDEFNLFLIEGSNTMKGDPVYKYLLWLGFGQGENIHIRSEVLAEIFRTYFTESNSLRTDAVYSKFANSVSTDFSIVDYRSHAEIIRYIFENGMAKVVIAKNINQLTGKK